MSKLTTYRGIPYTIAKGPSLRNSYQTRPAWHGVFTLRGIEERVEHDSKHATEQQIDIKALARWAEHLMAAVSGGVSNVVPLRRA
jgi:hypothetical protein